MQLLLTMLFVLVAPWAIAWGLGWNLPAAGRTGVAIIFLLGALAHYYKDAEMAQMMPPFIPWRLQIVWISGVMELAFGVAILALNLGWQPHTSAIAVCGIAIMLFFVSVFPINVYAAIHRIPLGGHDMGMLYLLIRTPVQLLLIVWTWFFFIHKA